MPHRQRAFKSFWSTPTAAMSLGCIGCPDLSICGGQTIDGSGFNCLDHCCNAPEDCGIVCPNSHVFADRIREVGGFELSTPTASPIGLTSLPTYVPMIFHGSARETELRAAAVAIPLYRFFNRLAECRFPDRESLAQSFRIGLGTDIVLSGVAQDDEVERWWKLETRGRIKAIANLRRLGVAIVTTPNFSLTVDRPRWDDLHSMRRIANAYHEFVSEGQAAALHVNGRTQHDFQRWAEYIESHQEVSHIAYEFTTGTKNPARMLQHAVWLTELAKSVGRRIGLIVRGGVQVADLLAQHFELSIIDSSPFEKAQHREIAFLDGEGRRRWKKRPTPLGKPIDDLFEENVRLSERWLAGLLPNLQLAA